MRGAGPIDGEDDGAGDGDEEPEHVAPAFAGVAEAADADREGGEEGEDGEDRGEDRAEGGGRAELGEREDVAEREYEGVEERVPPELGAGCAPLEVGVMAQDAGYGFEKPWSCLGRLEHLDASSMRAETMRASADRRCSNLVEPSQIHLRGGSVGVSDTGFAGMLSVRGVFGDDRLIAAARCALWGEGWQGLAMLGGVGESARR